jgi:hemoglobin-like flavoprotein
VTELYRAGAIDALCDTIPMLHAMPNALTDNMVERLFTFFEQMINTFGNEAMGDLAQNTRLALESAAEETAQTKSRGGGARYAANAI